MLRSRCRAALSHFCLVSIWPERVGARAANADHRNKAFSENLIRSVFLPRSSTSLRSGQWVRRFDYLDGLRDDILGPFSNLDCLYNGFFTVTDLTACFRVRNDRLSTLSRALKSLYMKTQQCCAFCFSQDLVFEDIFHGSVRPSSYRLRF